jgi:glycosyltransferase involved in cell wall biosynthesis
MTSNAHRGTPLVAVVTPVYNGATFLDETMRAVQAQTYPNLLHIVHDNASTDATPEILAGYRNARVPVEVERNEQTLPIGANWNAAVARVPREAKYFRILCADDLIEPEFVARTVDLAERRPTVMVVGCALKHRAADVAETRWDTDREVFPGREAVQRFFLGNGLIIAHQTLFRRSALDHRSPFFDEGLIANDTDTCLHLLHTGDWGFVHEVLAMTRDHPGAYSHAVTRMRLHQCDYLALLMRHAEYAFGPVEGQRWIRKYRRYYLRQVLRWRMGDTRAVYDRHVRAIKHFGMRPIAWQFLDAVADWPLVRVGLRPVWTGYPF